MDTIRLLEAAKFEGLNDVQEQDVDKRMKRFPFLPQLHFIRAIQHKDSDKAEKMLSRAAMYAPNPIVFRRILEQDYPFAWPDTTNVEVKAGPRGVAAPPQSATKAEPKPEAKPEPKSEPEAQSAPEPKTEPLPAPDTAKEPIEPAKDIGEEKAIGPEPIPSAKETISDESESVVDSVDASVDATPKPIPTPETPGKAEVLPAGKPELTPESDESQPAEPQPAEQAKPESRKDDPQDTPKQEETPEKATPKAPPETVRTAESAGSRRMSNAPIGFSRLSRGGIDWKLQTLIQIRSAMYLPLLRKIRSQMAEFGQPSTLEDVEIVIKPEHESLFRKQSAKADSEVIQREAADSKPMVGSASDAAAPKQAVDTKPEPQASQPEPQPNEQQPEATAEATPEQQQPTEAKQESEKTPEPAAKAEPQPEAKAEPQPESKPESKPQAEAQSISDDERESLKATKDSISRFIAPDFGGTGLMGNPAERKPDTRIPNIPKDEPKVEAADEPKASQPEAKPEPQAETPTEPQSEPKPEPQTEAPAAERQSEEETASAEQPKAQQSEQPKAEQKSAQPDAQSSEAPAPAEQPKEQPSTPTQQQIDHPALKNSKDSLKRFVTPDFGDEQRLMSNPAEHKDTTAKPKPAAQPAATEQKPEASAETKPETPAQQPARETPAAESQPEIQEAKPQQQPEPAAEATPTEAKPAEEAAKPDTPAQEASPKAEQPERKQHSGGEGFTSRFIAPDFGGNDTRGRVSGDAVNTDQEPKAAATEPAKSEPAQTEPVKQEAQTKAPETTTQETTDAKEPAPEANTPAATPKQSAPNEEMSTSGFKRFVAPEFGPQPAEAKPDQQSSEQPAQQPEQPTEDKAPTSSKSADESAAQTDSASADTPDDHAQKSVPTPSERSIEDIIRMTEEAQKRKAEGAGESEGESESDGDASGDSAASDAGTPDAQTETSADTDSGAKDNATTETTAQATPEPTAPEVPTKETESGELKTDAATSENLPDVGASTGSLGRFVQPDFEQRKDLQNPEERKPFVTTHGAKEEAKANPQQTGPQSAEDLQAAIERTLQMHQTQGDADKAAKSANAKEGVQEISENYEGENAFGRFVAPNFNTPEQPDESAGHPLNAGAGEKTGAESESTTEQPTAETPQKTQAPTPDAPTAQPEQPTAEQADTDETTEATSPTTASADTEDHEEDGDAVAAAAFESVDGGVRDTEPDEELDLSRPITSSSMTRFVQPDFSGRPEFSPIFDGKQNREEIDLSEVQTEADRQRTPESDAPAAQAPAVQSEPEAVSEPEAQQPEPHPEPQPEAAQQSEASAEQAHTPEEGAGDAINEAADEAKSLETNISGFQPGEIMDRETMGMGEKLEKYRKNLAEISKMDLPHPTQITPESIQDKFINSILGGGKAKTLSNRPKPEAEPAEQQPAEQSVPEQQPTDATSSDDTSIPLEGQPFDANAIEPKVSDADADDERSSVDDVIERYQSLEESLHKRRERAPIPDNVKKYDDLSLEEAELTNDQESSENKPVASETLAIINARQGNMAVAREMIQQLKLKNPEKSTYFDELLQRLESSDA